MFLDRRRSVRGLNFTFTKTAFELNFSARDAALWNVTQVRLTHCVVRTRFDTIPERDATSRSANLLRELLHVLAGF